ncbi:hypothetical protein ACFQGT_08060 [Natrialbaceae archaeon GCM10025810]|uniref:hypothetical protein n=1 Tax=Halovalidus salilacus TaxID=3075124 RepID=UPI00360B50FB
MSKEDRYAHIGDELDDADEADEQSTETDAGAANDPEADEEERRDGERPSASTDLLVTIADEDEEFEIHLEEADATAADLHDDLRREIDRTGRLRDPTETEQPSGPEPESAGGGTRSSFAAGAALGGALTAGLAAVLRRRRDGARDDD